MCVHCVLPSGSRKWWPTTVESITVREGDDEILADASLLYHTAYGYPAERAEAQFCKDKTVRTRPVSWTEAAWVFTDDDKPVAEELNTRTRGEGNRHLLFEMDGGRIVGRRVARERTRNASHERRQRLVGALMLRETRRLSRQQRLPVLAVPQTGMKG